MAKQFCPLFPLEGCKKTKPTTRNDVRIANELFGMCGKTDENTEEKNPLECVCQ